MMPNVAVTRALPFNSASRSAADREAEFAGLVRRQLELLGENPARKGLLKTPDVSRSRCGG